MALTYGFYNSFAGDRKYDAMQVSELFDGILADGIIPSQGQHFAVTAGGGMTLNVGTGRAWFFHTWTKNDSVLILTVPASDISRARIDAVVLEVNRDESVRANAIKIVQGTPAVNATKPTLVNTDKIHQYPLAYVTVGAGVEEIKAENIENAVGLIPTPFATGILETTPIDELWSQWEGEWDTWFSNIKLQLSGDIVTNLQGQIDAVRERLGELDVEIDLLKTGLAYVTLTCKTSNGQKLKGVHISGFCDLDKNSVTLISDGMGIVSGYVIPATNTSFSMVSMLDLNPASVSLSNVVAGNRCMGEIVISGVEKKQITSTTTGYVSNLYATADVTILGGGGGGAGGINCMSYPVNGIYISISGGGGGGGNVKSFSVTLDDGVAYSIKIGSGGSGGGTGDTYDYVNNSQSLLNKVRGRSGGDTSAFGETVSGGNGGGESATDYLALRSGGSSFNGGDGGYGFAMAANSNYSDISGSGGSSGRVKNPMDPSKYLAGGGGGGNGNNESEGSNSSPYYGGNSYGGRGSFWVSPNMNPSVGTLGGGGGGGRYTVGTASKFANGASGGSGAVFIVFS